MRRGQILIAMLSLCTLPWRLFTSGAAFVSLFLCLVHLLYLYPLTVELLGLIQFFHGVGCWAYLRRYVKPIPRVR
jgi:hypothetical protein